MHVFSQQLSEKTRTCTQTNLLSYRDSQSIIIYEARTHSSLSSLARTFARTFDVDRSRSGMPSPNTKLAALEAHTVNVVVAAAGVESRHATHVESCHAADVESRHAADVESCHAADVESRWPQMSHRSTNSRQAAKEYEAKRKGRDTLLLEANVSEKKAANECNDEEIYVAAQKLMLRELCDPTSTQCGFVQKDQQVAIRNGKTHPPNRPPNARRWPGQTL